jgi:cell wall-associated NlpC family hydrolase
MDRKLNIVVILIFLGLFAFACTPNIRFTSKNDFIYSNLKSRSKTQYIEPSERSSELEYASLLNIYKNSHELDEKRRDILYFVESWLGTDYCYGGNDKKCTDCSGFVMQIYESAGIRLPRTAALQYEFGEDVSEREIAPGDLVFFKRSDKIGHVGIYVGNNHFIHASTKRGVVLQDLNDDYYKRTFAGFKRVI